MTILRSRPFPITIVANHDLKLCHCQSSSVGLKTMPMTMRFRSFFCVCYFSLHLSLWTAAWVSFNEAGSNWSCFLLQLVSWECFMSIYVLPSKSFFLYLVSISLFNSHPSNRVLFLFSSLRAWDPVLFEAHPSARQWSFTGGRFLFCFQFFLQFVRLFLLKLVELAAGFDLASFRKNAVHSSPRPRCLGIHVYYL